MCIHIGYLGRGEKGSFLTRHKYTVADSNFFLFLLLALYWNGLQNGFKFFMISTIVSFIGFCLFVYCCSAKLIPNSGTVSLAERSVSHFCIAYICRLGFYSICKSEIDCKSFPSGLFFSFSSFVSRVFYWLPSSKEQFLHPGQTASSKVTYLKASKNWKENDKIFKYEVVLFNIGRRKGSKSWK